MKRTNIKFNILAIIVIIIISFAFTPKQFQNDTFYTIAVGERVVKEGFIQIDDFTWHENLTYNYPHWLYDVGTYLINSQFGFTGIYLTTVAFAIILGILIYILNSKITKNNLISFFITIGAMYLLKDYLAARAQIVTFSLFILEVFCIERFLQKGKKLYALGLILISILILNIHCAVWPFFFIIPIPYIAEYIISQISSKLKKKNLIVEKESYKIIIEKNKYVKWLILIVVICAFTGFITPKGTIPYTYLYKTMIGDTTKNINEHLPLTLINNKNFLCVIALFASILMLTDTKIKLRDLFMITGLLILALMSRRQIAMFVLIGSVILNKLICCFIDKYDKDGTKKMIKIISSIPGIIITICITAIISINFIKASAKEVYVNPSVYPIAATEYIINNIDVSTMKLYNEYNYGSYLLLNNIKVFIDSRADLYSPEFNEGKNIFMDFLSINNINTYYETKLEEYKITHVLIQKNSKLNLFLFKDPKYEKLYEDSSFVFYLRKSE